MSASFRKHRAHIDLPKQLSTSPYFISLPLSIIDNDKQREWTQNMACGIKEMLPVNYLELRSHKKSAAENVWTCAI